MSHFNDNMWQRNGSRSLFFEKFIWVKKILLICFFYYRSQSSREGNLDSADMESNSSRNSRDYWGNQQVRVNLRKKKEFNDLHELFRQAASPTSSRKDKTSSPSHSRRSTPSTKSSSRTKGVPQNFGYIKRTNGSSTATEMQTNAMLAGGRTVSAAMPRSSKLKVSGGTQTDFQQSKFNTICQRRRAVINDFHVTV